MFHDLIAMAQASQGAVDMLCRILASLDDDVISLEVPRCGSCPAGLLMHRGLAPRPCRDGARFSTRTRQEGGFKSADQGCSARPVQLQQLPPGWMDVLWGCTQHTG